MDVRGCCRWATALFAGAALLASAKLLPADSVKLDAGGSLNGSVTTGSKWVSVRTSTGAVIVFDRAAVKQVAHGHVLAAKTGSSSTNAAAKAQAKKGKLTAEEEAWLPKIRARVSRVYAGDRSRSQQARNALLAIDDTDAIPALSTYLGSSRNAVARHLYVLILHNMKGPKPVYYLVALSLYDPSPEIRAEARKALREDQLDSARRLYVAALRSGSPSLSRLAAIGLGEIGDPRGDSVPYLIDALVSYGTVATMRAASAQPDVLVANTIYATPGLKLHDPSAISMQQVGPSTLPVSSGPGGPSNNQVVAGQQNASGLGRQLAGGDNGDLPGQLGSLSEQSGNPSGQLGGQTAQGFSPNSNGLPGCQMNSGSSPSASTLTEADLYDPPHKKCGKHDKPLQGYVDHPEVLDALLKITDQPHPGYGFNQDRWRNWWTNEKTNRDLQKPAAPDRTIVSGSAVH